MTQVEEVAKRNERKFCLNNKAELIAFWDKEVPLKESPEEEIPSGLMFDEKWVKAYLIK